MTFTESPSTASSVLLYVGSLAFAALTWVVSFFACVFIRFGASGCNEVIPEEARQGQLSLAVVAGLAVAVWAGVWWLSRKRAGVAVIGVVAVLPAFVFFVQGLDWQSWGDGWCF